MLPGSEAALRGPANDTFHGDISRTEETETAGSFPSQDRTNKMTAKTDAIVVLVTAKNERECARMAAHLLDRKLIACANLVPRIRSLYTWQGKIADENECLMLLKSRRRLFAKIEREIRKIHSYSVPEIIALPIVAGSAGYLDWINESVKGARK